jgi:hypothetical protein
MEPSREGASPPVLRADHTGRAAPVEKPLQGIPGETADLGGRRVTSDDTTAPRGNRAETGGHVVAVGEGHAMDETAERKPRSNDGEAPPEFGSLVTRELPRIKTKRELHRSPPPPLER